MQWETIEVRAQWCVDYEQLVDLLNGLRLLARDVRIQRYQGDQGGPGELFFVIDLADLITLGGLIYLRSVFETLGSEHAKILNRKLMDVLQSGEGRGHFRHMYPLSIGADRTWFHISKPCSDEELMERFRLAANVVEHIEVRPLAESGSGDHQHEDQHFYYWSEQSDSWERMPVAENGPRLPDDAG